jgi:hypothetical protein
MPLEEAHTGIATHVSDRLWTLTEWAEHTSRQVQHRAVETDGVNRVGSISVACYKPRPGREEALLELVRNHLPPLRSEGLVTERAPIVMRCADGTIVEIFEWVSQEVHCGHPQTTPWLSTCGNSSKPYVGTRRRLT